MGQALREGEILKLRCSCEGGYPQPVIRWIKVSSVSKEERDVSARLEAGSGHQGSLSSSELSLRISASDNGATYKCSVMNEAVTSALNASVLLSPVYFMSADVRISPPDVVQVKSEEGMATEAVLVCESDECHPSCNLTWFLNGFAMDRRIASTSHASSASGENGGFKTRSRLQLVKVWSSREHGSTLTCASTNNLLRDKRASKNITVQVLCK